MKCWFFLPTIKEDLRYTYLEVRLVMTFRAVDFLGSGVKHTQWKSPLAFILGILIALPSLRTNFWDDAYIHARLARNLNTHGIAFFIEDNESKIGSSTGYVFLVGTLGNLLDYLTSIRIIQFLTIVLTCWSLGIFIRTFVGAKKIMAIVVSVTIMPSFLLAAFGGMETSIVCFLLIWTVINVNKQKYRYAVFLLSVAACFRFETIALLIGLLFVLAIHRPVQLRVKSLLLPLVPIMATLCYELILFRTIVPHASFAKRHGYNLPLRNSTEHTLTTIFGDFYFVSLLFIVVLVLIGARFRKSEIPTNIGSLYVGFSGLLLFVWSTSQSLVFPWYTSLFTFTLGLGIVQLIPNSKLLKIPILDLITAFISISILVFTVFPKSLGTLNAFFGPNPTDRSSVRIERYKEIGKELYQICPGCTLLTSEIGGLGYSFKGLIYDAFGLGDESATKYHPLQVPYERQDYGIGAIPPAYVDFRKPDFIVSMPTFSLALRESNSLGAYFKYECPLDRTTNLDIWGSTTVEIYTRQELPPQVLKDLDCY